MINPYLRRKLTNYVMSGVMCFCAGLALLALVSISGYVVVKGFSALSLSFFTQLPKPVGEVGGGIGNAILGSLILLLIAALVGLPIGIMAGIYLSEFAGRLSPIIRFIADVMSGIPSIVIGIFIYALIVLPMGTFSALAGGIALGLIMVPIVARATEEALKMVPLFLREAALALGIPKWRTVISIVIPSAIGGILTGGVLALARAGGETAPLLFTALSSRFWPMGIDKPIASLPVYIFTYGISPYPEWHSQAWGAALILMVMVLMLSLLARLFARRGSRA